MKKLILLVVLTISTIFTNVTSLRAQTGDFGFGLILIEPLGATVKYWTAPNQAIDADIGESYFGAPRVDVDYLGISILLILMLHCFMAGSEPRLDLVMATPMTLFM